MNTVIVEPNLYTGSKLVQTIALNLTQPDLPMKFVSKELDDIFDNSDNSYREFVDVMTSLPLEEKWLTETLFLIDNLSVVRTRLLNTLIKENNKVLYITYNKQDINLLRKKRKVVDQRDSFDIEEFLSSMSEETYNFCRADIHPTWDEFKAGTVHPEFLIGPDDVDIVNDPLSQWTYNTPDDNKLCREITFNSILNGYNIIDNIADLLGVKVAIDQKPLIDEYREKFFEVDY